MSSRRFPTQEAAPAPLREGIALFTEVVADAMDQLDAPGVAVAARHLGADEGVLLLRGIAAPIYEAAANYERRGGQGDEKAEQDSQDSGWLVVHRGFPP